MIMIMIMMMFTILVILYFSCYFREGFIFVNFTSQNLAEISTSIYVYLLKDIWSLLHAIFRTIGGNTEVLKKTLLGNLSEVFRSVGSLFVELN